MRTACQTPRRKRRLLQTARALGMTLALICSHAVAAEQPTTALVAEPTTNVVRATLPNGLQVVIVPDRLAPVVTTKINYLVGSNDAPEGFPGTAHALEHMMFRGSKDLDRDQLSELGALLGGSFNAVTTETVTQYFYTVPSADLGVALRIEAGRMRGLILDEADWVQERGAIEQEVSRDLSSPNYNLMSQLQAIMFAGTPYEHDALGTRDSFDKTDAVLLRRFYDRWYAPNNAVLVIAGDVAPNAALAQVEAAFGDIPRRELPAHTTATIGSVQPKTLHMATDFGAGVVVMAYQMPGLKAHDFAAADLLCDVLGSRRGALYGLVPAGHALTSQFVYRPKPDVGYALAIAAFPRGGDPNPLLDEMRQVIARIADQGVPPELLEAERGQELAQLEFMSDSISGLAESWSKALVFQGRNAPEDAAAAYKAATIADVDRLARQLLDPDHAVTAILTPQTAKQPGSSVGFGGAETFGGAPDTPVVLPQWASDALAAFHVPKPGMPADVSVLDNGLRLIVLPLQVGHTISVYGQVRQVDKMQEPAGKEGVAQVTAQMFGYGSESLDRLAFQTALDDIAAYEEAGPRFELKILASHFEDGMKLLADNELHPAFLPDSFSVVRRQLAQSLSGLLQSPDYRFKRAIQSAIVPVHDPALRQATAETVAALTLADVKSYYQDAYRPDLTTIVVVGDVTPDEARRVVMAEFGGWSPPGPMPEIQLPAIPDNPPSQLHVPDPTAIQDTVALVQTVGLMVTDPSRYALMLGNSILGDGSSSRLYRDLRTRTGYVYSVGSWFNWSPTRGQFAVTFGSDPQNVGLARSIVSREMKDMQDNPVSAAELARAKAQILRRLPMQRASVDATAALYLWRIELGLPLDAEVTAATRYVNTTAPEIQDAFRMWLRPDDLVQVVKGPTPP